MKLYQSGQFVILHRTDLSIPRSVRQELINLITALNIDQITIQKDVQHRKEIQSNDNIVIRDKWSHMKGQIRPPVSPHTMLFLY